MPQSEFGQHSSFLDFNGTYEDVTWAAGTVDLGNGWGMTSVNEGTIQKVVDEGGGVIQFLSDTGDNDNVALFSGPYDPSQGPVTVEARFKIADASLGAIFVGLSETLAMDTPVMPAEFATATMSYNGSGGIVGAVWDDDATTEAWKAVSGDGGAVAGSAAFGANGTNATNNRVDDEYDIVRVTLYPSGFAEVWHDEELVVGGATGLTVTDLFYCVVMAENRAAAAIEFEVDYVYASATRDWAVS